MHTIDTLTALHVLADFEDAVQAVERAHWEDLPVSVRDSIQDVYSAIDKARDAL